MSFLRSRVITASLTANAIRPLPGFFDILPSIPSAHIVRAIASYLAWHWNAWTSTEESAEPRAASVRP